jgi:drug/metabolite transporter (DMT)-like permease
MPPSETLVLRKGAILPYLALAIGILVLGFSAIFVRWANAPGPVVAFYRLGIATAFLTPFFLYRHRRKPLSLPGRVWLIPVVAGCLTAMDHTIWNTSLHATSAANATLLNNAAPVWVALFAWLVFHERLSARFWAGLVLTLGGALGVLGSDFLRHPALGWGDSLAILSSLFYAGYFLATQRGRQHLDTLSYIWMVGVCSTLVLLLVCLGLGLPLSGYPANTYLALLGAALISQLGGYLSVGYALGHLPASTVSPTMIGQPVMTAVLALPLLGEALRPAQIFGGGVVLFGILLVHLSRQGRPTVNRVAPGSLDPLKLRETQPGEPDLV